MFPRRFNVGYNLRIVWAFLTILWGFRVKGENIFFFPQIASLKIIKFVILIDEKRLKFCRVIFERFSFCSFCLFVIFQISYSMYFLYWASFFNGCSRQIIINKSFRLIRLTLSLWRSVSYRSQSILVCRANQWAGFYMIGTTSWKS